MYNVLIYEVYPESFFCRKSWYTAFSDSHLQNKRIWSESGDKEVHEAANHGRQISSSQPHLLWWHLQVLRVFKSEQGQYSGMRADQ